MFGISFSEIILICGISLVVFGPKKIPVIVSIIAKFMFQLKSYINTIKHNLYANSGLPELSNARDDLINIYNDLHDTINLKNQQEMIFNDLDTTLPEEKKQLELDFKVTNNPKNIIH